MNREKIFFIVAIILAIGLCFSWNVISATQKENKDINLELERAQAYGEIQNIIAAHTYCYEAQQQAYEIENFWSKRDDISYSGQNGRKAVINYFVNTNNAARKAKLKRMSELFPDEVKNVPENEGIGDMVIHLLTTPYIQVAGDCKTAKGLWYVPSINVEIGMDGEPVPVTIWEKCEVDFIKEDGQWKIWHFTQWVQFAHVLDKDIVGPAKLDRPFFQAQPLEGGGERQQGPPPEEAQSRQGVQAGKNRDLTYSTKRVADWRPELPGPYDSWDDSISAVRH